MKELRERRFLSQAGLAQKTGLGRDTVNRLEAGKQKPTFQTIRKLAEVLGVTPREIDFPQR